MKTLKERLSAHTDKLNKHEELEAQLAGVFNVEAKVINEEFTEFVRVIIRPAFEQFKTALREVGRDAVIVQTAPEAPVPAIAVVLSDRYLKFGKIKTMTLINPKDDYTKNPKSKYYEIFRTDGCIHVRQQADPDIGAMVTPITYGDLNPIFLENELGCFFERAYPAPI